MSSSRRPRFICRLLVLLLPFLPWIGHAQSPLGNISIYSFLTLESSYHAINITIESTYVAPTALAVYARPTDNNARVYYTIDGSDPTFESPYVMFNTPYIHLTNGSFLQLIAFSSMIDVYGHSHFARSRLYQIRYHAEASKRPDGYGYLVPGIETSGYFVGLRLEMNFSAIRAQKPKGQEFAEYYSYLGKGPYKNQLTLLPLLETDPDLTGFEGGYFINSSSHNYAVLVPHHNGRNFSGKVVLIDLNVMLDNSTLCAEQVHREYFNLSTGKIIYSGPNVSTACITVLDLSALHPNATGFRRGFVGYPYVYLSPGEYSVAIRLDINSFTLNSTRIVDMSLLDPTFGGYAGGFIDGDWACFSPYRTYIGPVGVGGKSGIRSSYRDDRFQLQPFYYSVLACLHNDLWFNQTGRFVTYDFSKVYPSLQGFSDAVKIGRYAYFSPFMDSASTYSSTLVRLYLGDLNDVGQTIEGAISSNSLRKLTTVLDLSYLNDSYRGFSGLFNSGKYLYLVPYRNYNQPSIGNRGHGNVIRVDLNDFTLNGIQVVDTSAVGRAQIPNDTDVDLRGYSYGFAEGNYAVFVPFYSGVVSGKMGRIRLSNPYNLGASNFTDDDVQALDLTEYLQLPGVLRGFSGGFTLPELSFQSLIPLGIVGVI